MHAAGRVIGRYILHDEIASGGMAAVHIGRLRGPVGFSRTVAIKRLHPQFAKDPEFVSMFLDEARLAARIAHPNVAATIDVIALGSELFLVMEYIQGESLSRLLRAARQHGEPLPLRIGLSIVVDVLYGLHAAHEATSETGEPLDIVHRDVSPHNVIVGKDGTARVLDFGIAKATMRIQTTREGQLKGKLAYMAPEQLQRKRVDRRTDIFAASIVLWETVTGERLFAADSEGGIITRILTDPIEAPSAHNRELPPELDRIVLKGLARAADERFTTAREMAAAIEQALEIARPAEVGAYVERVAGEVLAQRAQRLAVIEGSASSGVGEVKPPTEGGTEATMRMVDGASDDTASEPVTHMSSVSSPPPRAKLKAPVLAIALLLLSVFGGILVWMMANARRGEPPVAAKSAVPTASAEPRPSAEPPAAATPTPAMRPATKRSKGADCVPPYYYETLPNGVQIKRFKPQCI